ncbi:TetR/AcrR family transcriptional regulator [Nitratireductor sp. XY-223]|uniref:TetR/AcrR family transcriptional regulator n=1 Tax=Nitratireductor sp. XY-223 TaxID=2561926 RepID=UPI0010AB24C4|nr:TetR/AcrR family transcriptional regulator [Nitratireductor sp. XY-223]
MARKIADIRRPEIVDALYKAIDEDGISLPGYDQIARRGEMSRQLIRHYFGNVDDMAVALCDALAAVYKDCLMKGIIAADESRRLEVFLDFYFNFLSAKGLPKPADDAVYDALFAYASTSDAVRDRLRDQYTLLQMTLAHEIQISHPELHQSGCQELGYLIVVVMYGHWKMVASLGFSEDYNRVSRQSLDRLIASYTENYTPQD